MLRYALILVLMFAAAHCRGQAGNKVIHDTVRSYEELKRKQVEKEIKQMVYIDSTYRYQAVVPEWLQLIEAGSPTIWGGSLPAVDGIENAIFIKGYPKSRFASLHDFKKYVVEDVVIGRQPPWSSQHTSVGKKELGVIKKIGDGYKAYFIYQGKMYHCEYVLTETETAYLWIDFTATQETFDKNHAKFDEFLDGFKVLDEAQ